MRALLLLLLLSFPALTQSLSVSLERGNSSYSKGDTAIIAATVTIPEGFHLYANPLGPGIGKALSLSVENVNGITWLDAFSDPSSKYVQDEKNWVWQWDNTVHFFIRGIVGESAPTDIPVLVSFDGLICKTACIPQKPSGTVTLIVSENNGAPPFSHSKKLSKQFKNAVPFPLEKKSINEVIQELTLDDFLKEDLQESWNYEPREASSVLAGTTKTRSYNIGLAIFLAFIAGIILNFMPCVLPVLGIKILSFSEGRAGNKSTAIKNSIAFATGMILVFLILGTFAAFAGMSWGEQFQNPVFTIVLITMMFGFGLGMFDLFILLVPSKISEMEMKQDSHSMAGNFGKGIFATLLATPCSGPFLGATLAWTLTQPKPVIYAVFLALGVGMASPYIVLAASERLSRIIPKPGAWMEDFKHILGFFLFGFAIYLMIGLPQELVLPTVAFQAIIAGAIILYGRLAPFGSSVVKKIVAILVVAGLIGYGYHLSFTTIRGTITAQYSTGVWEEFSLEELENAHANGENVVVDFTALWCMNCQYNKKTVYKTAAMDSLIDAKSIRAFTADMTNDNPTLEKLRSQLGSESIPFFVVFPSDNPEKPIIFRDIVTRESVFSVLRSLPE